MAVGSLSAGEWAVLGAVSEGPTHGFAVSQQLAKDGVLGCVWGVPRPMVYQALSKLLTRGYVRELATEQSNTGPTRTIVQVTPSGRKALEKWLLSPVPRLRDIRPLLLLKLGFLYRAHRDAAPLLDAQRVYLLNVLATLLERRSKVEGIDWIVLEWRLTSTQGTLKFLDVLSETEWTNQA